VSASGLVLVPTRALFVQATIAGGGVIPHIHKSLINKPAKKDQVM
jgi:C-terminus of histone H2A